ncbi:MAG: VOC family protein [bacterium]
MRISSVSVSTKNMQKSIEFFKILGFKFEENKSQEQHVENIHIDSDTKLMIDTEDMLKSILGYEPKPSNCSTFAILYDTVADLDTVSNNIKNLALKL